MFDTMVSQTDCEQQGSLIDAQSEHFVPFIVLSSFVREQGGYSDPSQEITIGNSIWRLVAENHISLKDAQNFIASQPKPIPRNQKILDAWWRGAQNKMEYRRTTVRRDP